MLSRSASDDLEGRSKVAAAPSPGSAGYFPASGEDVTGPLARQLFLFCWSQQNVDQCVGQPLFVAGWRPSPIEDQLGVQVGAAQRPDDSQRFRRRDARAQPTTSLQAFVHAIPDHPAQSLLLPVAVVRQQARVTGLAQEAKQVSAHLVDEATDAR